MIEYKFSNETISCIACRFLTVWATREALWFIGSWEKKSSQTQALEIREGIKAFLSAISLYLYLEHCWLGGGDQQIQPTKFKRSWFEHLDQDWGKPGSGRQDSKSFLECILSAAEPMNLKAAQWGIMNKFLLLERANGN